jgi:hypothetical protein
MEWVGWLVSYLNPVDYFWLQEEKRQVMPINVSVHLRTSAVFLKKEAEKQA